MVSAILPASLLVLSVFLNYLPTTQGKLYVVEPESGSTCHASQDCTVSWLDDGETPILTDIGACTVGLYWGDQNLVQTIDPINVGSSHSLTFQPNPNAGSDGNVYYIAFQSLEANDANSSSPYIAYSPSFSIDGMTGGSTPDPSLTSSIPVPSSLMSPATNGAVSTETIGTISSVGYTSLTASTPSSSASSMTSVRSSTLLSSSGSSATASAAEANSTSGSSSSASSGALSSRLFDSAAFVLVPLMLSLSWLYHY